ncbi:hypothetical protein [Streptomyces sp. NPDC058674]|uniref:hypothetical protein n=1 Tax=Streptomyces sp. NPDC058674 TaxID=3346592 RepID=UPI0036692FBC
MARERIRWPLVVDCAREIVDGYAPLKVTLRRVMHRLAAEGVLPHTPPMYRQLSAQLAQARREGGFPDLIDTVREVHVPPAWPDAYSAPGCFLCPGGWAAHLLDGPTVPCPAPDPTVAP